jgi:hypothetical protein
MKKKEVAIIPASCLLFFLFIAHDGLGKEVSIFEAVKKGLVDLNLSSRGGHSENCVNVRVKYLGTSPSTVVIEPGTILDNLNEAQQDIIVVRSLKMNLLPYQTLDTVAYGFCCQSSHGSPRPAQKFGLLRMADNYMAALCKYIQNNNIDCGVAQNAIWTLSNGHQVASVGEPSNKTLAGLIQLCAQSRSVIPPWYHINYRKIPGVVFSNDVCRVVLNFEYTKKSDKNLCIAVYDSCGRKIKTLLSNSYAMRGVKKFHFDFDIVNWPSGKYMLKVDEWEQEPYSKTFEL